MEAIELAPVVDLLVPDGFLDFALPGFLPLLSVGFDFATGLVFLFSFLSVFFGTCFPVGCARGSLFFGGEGVFTLDGSFVGGGEAIFFAADFAGGFVASSFLSVDFGGAFSTLGGSASGFFTSNFLVGLAFGGSAALGSAFGFAL
ncbi:MAG: hypothetical protein ACK6A7_03165 [Planctomycetota bacterium]